LGVNTYPITNGLGRARQRAVGVSFRRHHSAHGVGKLVGAMPEGFFSGPAFAVGEPIKNAPRSKPNPNWPFTCLTPSLDRAPAQTVPLREFFLTQIEVIVRHGCLSIAPDREGQSCIANKRRAWRIVPKSRSNAPVAGARGLIRCGGAGFLR
jgi:hypothetical protein